MRGSAFRYADIGFSPVSSAESDGYGNKISLPAVNAGNRSCGVVRGPSDLNCNLIADVKRRGMAGITTRC